MSLEREGRRAFPTNVERHAKGIWDAAPKSCLKFISCALGLVVAPQIHAALTTPQPAPAPYVAATQGFAGIAWGSPADTIEEKFGEAAERDDESCNDDLARSALAEQGHDCFVVRMDRYVLDGIPYSASFRFDPRSKGLGAVVLTASLKSRNLDPRAVRKVQAECRQTFDKMALHLSGQFPSAILPHQMFGRPNAPFARGNYKAWEAGDTSVLLSRSFGYTEHWKRWRRADGCEIEVRYSAVPAEEETSAE